MKKRLTPARLVAARFGGIRPLARAMDWIPSRISKWNSRGGKIPNVVSGGKEDTYSQLLKAAKAKGIKLTLDEILSGGYL